MLVSITVSLAVISCLASASATTGSSIIKSESLKELLSQASRLVRKSHRSNNEEVELTILRLKLARFRLTSPEISIQVMPDKFSRTTPIRAFQVILRVVDESLGESANLDRLARAYLQQQGYSLTEDNVDIDDSLTKLSKLTSFALSKDTSYFDSRLALVRLNVFRKAQVLSPPAKLEMIRSLAESAQYAILDNLESTARPVVAYPVAHEAHALLDSVIEESKMIFSADLVHLWVTRLESIIFNLKYPPETRQNALALCDSFNDRESIRALAKSVFSLDNIKARQQVSLKLSDRMLSTGTLSIPTSEKTNTGTYSNVAHPSPDVASCSKKRARSQVLSRSRNGRSTCGLSSNSWITTRTDNT